MNLPKPDLMRFAEYGNVLVQADNLAKQRGSGQYNPGPKYEQTTNRGPAYSRSLADFANGPNIPINGSLGQNYYNYDKGLKAANENIVKSQFANIQQDLDKAKIRPYVVGSTGFHIEKQNSWSKPQFEESYGPDRYTEWARASLKIAPNALLNFFFCEDNINYIQSLIKSEVKMIRGIDIKDQSVDELLIIMRNKYTYALSGWLPYDEKNPDKVYARGDAVVQSDDGPRAYSTNPNSGTSLENQIKRLNQATVEECLKSVLGGIDAYLKYYSDSSSMPLPMSNPVLTTMKGSNSLQENLGFESAYDMNKSISSYNERFNII
jgi:hypothetical protein